MSAQEQGEIQPEEFIEPNAQEKSLNQKIKKDQNKSNMMSQEENYQHYNLQQKLDRENSLEHQSENIQENQEPMQDQSCEQGQEDQEYQYQEYADEEGYDNYYNQMEEMNLQKRHSSDHNYQYDMSGLLSLIQKQCKKVQQLTGFSFQWALIYYESCGWKLPLVQKFIDQKGTNISMIGYNNCQAQITDISGQCPICCEDQKVIYKNACQDQFCEDCWKGQLVERMKYHKDPFPPCLNQDCAVRTSPFICSQIAKNDVNFKVLYQRTLCRSYAKGSTSVKICKGREKVSCDKCFHVKKIFQLIECQTCGNFVCARCGQQYHHPAECYDGKNWRKICEDSTNFIDTLDYRICPYCKEAVQRKSGCNSMVCTCKQVFCYICGQKWLPNHNQHGVCYRQAEIKKLRQQKLKKLQNEKQYTDKLQKFKAELQPVLSMIKKIQEVDTQAHKNNLINQFHILSNDLHYLKELKKKTQVVLLVWKNSIVSQYFKQNLIMQAHCDNLKQQTHKAYDFLIAEIPGLMGAFNLESIDKTKIVVQIREKVKNPLQYLNQKKIEMLNIMKKIQKFIDL